MLNIKMFEDKISEQYEKGISEQYGREEYTKR